MVVDDGVPRSLIVDDTGCAWFNNNGRLLRSATDGNDAQNRKSDPRACSF